MNNGKSDCDIEKETKSRKQLNREVELHGELWKLKREIEDLGMGRH
jgi:hypothetical protein